MFKIIVIGIGGAIGAFLRYVISGITYKFFDGLFPYGTLSVNLLGALFIGLLWGISEKITFSPDLRIFVFVGILGAFTTFSTYTLETLNLLRDGEIKIAMMNILVSNIFGILLVFAGFIASKYLILFFRR